MLYLVSLNVDTMEGGMQKSLGYFHTWEEAAEEKKLAEKKYIDALTQGGSVTIRLVDTSRPDLDTIS